MASDAADWKIEALRGVGHLGAPRALLELALRPKPDEETRQRRDRADAGQPPGLQEKPGEAGRHGERHDEALKIDPLYAPAHAQMAWELEQIMVRGGGTEADVVAGVTHARAALVYGGDDAAALAIASLPILHLAHDFEAASGAIARAISLNGSCATALYFGSHVHAWCGDVAKAEDYALPALRLSPFDPLSYHAYLALGTVRVRQKLYAELGGVSRQGTTSQSAVQHAVCFSGFGAGARGPRR